MKHKLNFVAALLLTAFISFGQTTSQQTFEIKSMVISWNKDTPEQEMVNDIKKLSEHGVVLKYDNVKRNNANEIIAIEVSYTTKLDDKGYLKYDGSRPIGVIKIYKQNNDVGFGEPPVFGGGLSFSSEVLNEDKLMQDYGNFSKKKSSSTVSSRTQIMRSDRQPLVLENGKVIEGGNDYTKAELDEILKENNANYLGNEEFKSFNYTKAQDFQEELAKMRQKIEELGQPNLELQQLQKELEQSKKELEETKKENEKTKSSLKVKKA